ncbi:YbaN family protein [Novosphingobium gossypii]|uniref:YbaN family protein n=1 Tax=Novosphingobium gossypii TaxID=1604774 RepID=UPI003D1975EF
MNRAGKYLWIAAGVILVGIGTLGIFLPLLPTTIFWILAAGCFSKSHPEWAERLYDHPKYGHHLREWRDRRAISRKGKIAAIGTMALSVGIVWFTAGELWALIPLAVLATVGTWIWTRAE